MTPSFAARFIGAILRITRIYSKRFAGGSGFLAIIRKSRQLPQMLPSAKMRAQLLVEERELLGHSIWHIAPKNTEPSAHILFFHGGGYVFRPIFAHWKFFGHMAKKRGIAVTAPLYPLAPENGVEQATVFAMAAYRDFIAKHPGPFILAGDSAGGGLASSVAHLAREEGLRQASGMILICPWLDGSVSHPDQPEIEIRDCILHIRGAQDAAKLYARSFPVSDPRVSPILGQWDSMPPILMFGGGDDILVTDARALKAKLPSVDYDERAGLMHDWPLFFLRESREAQAKMAAFATSLKI
jgi:epsilon-lactone hydrolase